MLIRLLRQCFINQNYIMVEPYNSLGVFIDGGYLAKINEALADQMDLNVNIKGLFEYISHKVAELYGDTPENCPIVESHYFRGRFRAESESRMHLLFNERKFEDSLIENDVVFHYKHLRQCENNGRQVIIEKGIDVWFALEAFELALHRKFDFVVLMTGDADHEMLIRKLKALKIRVILLNWNLGPQSSTSHFLVEEACSKIDLGDMVAEDSELLDQITVRKY